MQQPMVIWTGGEVQSMYLDHQARSATRGSGWVPTVAAARTRENGGVSAEQKYDKIWTWKPLGKINTA